MPIYYYPWSPILDLLLILEEPSSLTLSSLEELSGDLSNSFKIQVGRDCIPVYLLIQSTAGPRPVITHAGHADRRCCSPYPGCTPQFPSCGNQGRGEEGWCSLRSHPIWPWDAARPGMCKAFPSCRRCLYRPEHPCAVIRVLLLICET